eukprot:5527501-Pyramimonas_sp.AAC.1
MVGSWRGVSRVGGAVQAMGAMPLGQNEGFACVPAKTLLTRPSLFPAASPSALAVRPPQILRAWPSSCPRSRGASSPPKASGLVIFIHVPARAAVRGAP